MSRFISLSACLAALACAIAVTLVRVNAQSQTQPPLFRGTTDKDTSSPGLGGRPTSQAQIIDRAHGEDVMIYAIGMRSRGPRPSSPGIGPGALQTMLMVDLPDPGLARVAEETGGGYVEIRYGS